MTVRIYCLMDGTIKTVKLGADINLYEKDKGAWNIESFIVSDSMYSQLMYSTEKAVKSCLNYPSTADFPLLDWSIGRDFNVYNVSSHVKAKNAFGVEEDLPFNATYLVDGEDGTLVFLMVDGTVVKEVTYEKSTAKRKKVKVKEINSADVGEGIHLVDGELGEYGEKVQLDSSELIWYRVPAGTYEVTCNTKQCTVFVDKNEFTRNSDGFVEMENVATYDMKYEEKKNIEIKEDEHIFMTVNADIILKPMK